ncbi:hypothetical protein EJ06DRAFT_163965 [Trichodelitschia bisporula]|uniref:Uncharacterized protein n=1 Tax=Trichodelitschia bisporula TaxID=703511 RepID=A0A6G1HMB8_9PEZI|nr:hypothetical protein EJ06DRAFT_163965 [Trichodelitschia bisporula]
MRVPRIFASTMVTAPHSATNKAIFMSLPLVKHTLFSHTTATVQPSNIRLFDIPFSRKSSSKLSIFSRSTLSLLRPCRYRARAARTSYCSLLLMLCHLLTVKQGRA